jgi:hypothetical protein
MPCLLAILGGCYLTSLIALLAVGVVPGVPWPILLGFFIQLVPLSLALVQLLAWSEKKLGGWPGALAAGIWSALGLLLVWFCNWTAHPAVTIAVALFAVWHFVVGPGRAWLKPLGASVAVLILGFGAVWNINYLAGALIPREALIDPALIDCDLAIYGWLGYDGAAYGMFPAVHDPAALRLLEHAYMLYYDEIFATIFVLIATRANLTRFFAVMFGCFLVGIPVFLLWPSVGPFTYTPETVAQAWHGSNTWKLMSGVIADYDALGAGAALQGFGYFIALPSMHVAVATVLQTFLWRQRSAFWAFLPVNLLLFFATFLLGYHYVVDAPAGLAVAGVVLAADCLIRRVRVASPSGLSRYGDDWPAGKVEENFEICQL